MGAEILGLGAEILGLGTEIPDLGLGAVSLGLGTVSLRPGIEGLGGEREGPEEGIPGDAPPEDTEGFHPKTEATGRDEAGCGPEIRERVVGGTNGRDIRFIFRDFFKKKISILRQHTVTLLF